MFRGKVKTGDQTTLSVRRSDPPKLTKGLHPAETEIYQKHSLGPSSDSQTAEADARQLTLPQVRPSIKNWTRRGEGVEPILSEACSQGYPESAICVQKLDDSLNSAIRITYRISLRSSSVREPRYPLLRVVQRFV